MTLHIQQSTMSHFSSRERGPCDAVDTPPSDMAGHAGRRVARRWVHQIVSPASRRVWRTCASMMACLGGLAAVGIVTACSPDKLVRSDPPSNILTPGAVKTPTAAMALYNGATTMFAAVYGGGGNTGYQQSEDNYIVSTGLLTDEFLEGPSGLGAIDPRVNSRLFGTGAESEQASLYTDLQAVRTGAFQARQALQRYGPPHSDALIGQMYSLEAYSIIFLAEYFCDGIPLSQIPLEGDPTLTPAMTSAQLYSQALALLDTAVTLSADSATFLNLAKVGRGRVLLDQAQFAQAAQAVQDVPQSFVYNVNYQIGGFILLGGHGFSFENTLEQPQGNPTSLVTADQEGGNGLVWSTDPRVAAQLDNSLTGGYPWSNKYPSGNSPIRLADGIEAQLIQAEASLNAGSSDWLTILTNLRNTCTSASGCAPVPDVTPTSYPSALVDSGTASGRLSTLMAERAYWMFATGHREGDLRRLLRPPYNAPPYSRRDNNTYPTGSYSWPNLYDLNPVSTTYGTDVVAMPARAEQQYNHLYHGCIDLNP